MHLQILCLCRHSGRMGRRHAPSVLIHVYGPQRFIAARLALSCFQRSMVGVRAWHVAFFCASAQRRAHASSERYMHMTVPNNLPTTATHSLVERHGIATSSRVQLVSFSGCLLGTWLSLARRTVDAWVFLCVSCNHGRLAFAPEANSH